MSSEESLIMDEFNLPGTWLGSMPSPRGYARNKTVIKASRTVIGAEGPEREYGE